MDAVRSLPTAGNTVPAGSLRAELDKRRASGNPFTPREAVSLLVPLCTELAELHAGGKALFVNPTSLDFIAGSLHVALDRSKSPPSDPHDKACLAPEERKASAPGDARASVFAIGAILYELLTGQSIGPAMRRPSEVVPGLPPMLETALGKALVADPKHRPSDLGALAQALHNSMPGASIAPPPADESHLDHDADFEVDVKLSMLPPAPRGALPSLDMGTMRVDGAFAVVERKAAAANPADPTHRLATLKATLEADDRPRWVVIKDGMDHGPFSAVELLQQIASHQFVGENLLRDGISGQELAISEWEEFAPFAEQAKLNRDIKKERAALEAVVVAEKRGTQYKAILGVGIVGVLVAAGAGYWYREKSAKERETKVQADNAVAIDVSGGLAGTAKAGPGGGRPGGGTMPGGGSGNYPVLAGGMSCEAAQARYSEEYKIGGGTGQPDLSAGAYGAVLNKGSYLNACGVPPSTSVSVCAAVQNGRAVGVTVRLDPPNPGVAGCVASQVRGLPFPAHPRLDVTHTTFAGQ